MVILQSPNLGFGFPLHILSLERLDFHLPLSPQLLAPGHYTEAGLLSDCVLATLVVSTTSCWGIGLAHKI